MTVQKIRTSQNCIFSKIEICAYQTSAHGAKIWMLKNDIVSTNKREWALIPSKFSEFLLSVARPFHALVDRISCNTFLESLKHTDQP